MRSPQQEDEQEGESRLCDIRPQYWPNPEIRRKLRSNQLRRALGSGREAVSTLPRSRLRPRERDFRTIWQSSKGLELGARTSRRFPGSAPPRIAAHRNDQTIEAAPCT